MTHPQMVAICNALKYIITESVPVPKTAAAKRKRTELLQSLTNAARAPKEVAPSAADSAAAAASGSDPAVTRLEVAMVQPPPGETARVRPGTVKSLPVTATDGAVADEP